MVYIILGTGFEEIEAMTPADVLRRAGVDVAFVGIADKTVTGAHGIKVLADEVWGEQDVLNAELVILPGGAVRQAGNYGCEEHVLSKVKERCLAGGKLAAICAGPTVLGEHGLLKGKCAVCYPGMEDYMTGAKVMEGSKVVLDGSVMTAQGPGAAGAFALNILAWLRGRDAAEEVRGEMYMAPVDYVV